MRRYDWIVKSLPIAICGALLSACGGGGGSGGSDTPSAAQYNVEYQAPESAFVGAGAQLDLMVSDSKEQMLAIKSAPTGKYAVEVTDNPAFIVSNECKEVTLGQPCKIMLSLSEQAEKKNIFKFMVVLPNGQKKSYSHVFLKKSVLTNVSQESVLPTKKSNVITIVNNSRQSMYINTPQVLDENNKVLSNVKITQNSCHEKIPPSSECQFHIQSDGVVKGQLKLFSALPIIKSLSFSNVVVKSNNLEGVPANAVRGMSYPFSYSFTNTSSQLPATNVSFSNNFPKGAYSFDEKESTCSGIKTLAPNGSCIWKGVFNSAADGDQPLSILLNYAEGSSVGLNVNSHVASVSIRGEKLEDIPVNVQKNKHYPFVYMFTNTNDALTATNVSFTHVFPESEYTIDHINSTCEGIKTLAPKASCAWQGVFEPNVTGSKDLVATLSYQGGQDVILHSHSNTTEVEVAGQKLRDIPENVAQGREYPFNYIFTNLSHHFTAKGVSFSNVFPADYHIDDANSSCKGITELAPGASCSWQGKFKPTKTGNQVISSMLHYEEGEDILLSSASQVTGVVVTAQKAQEIPENVIKDKSYPFHYIFQNTSKTTSATNVSFTQDFPGGEYVFDEAASTCMNINALSANATCSWVGVFTPKTNGIKSHSMILHYTEGKDVELNASSVVSEVGIGADEILGVPVNTSTGSSYPFNYVFTNLSSIHKATGISFTNVFPDGFTVDAEKSTCLGISELAPNALCSWQGTFAPNVDEDAAWSITLHYHQGADVPLNKSTTSSTVVVEGSKTNDLPANMAKGVTYPFTYTFMNLNEFYPATNVSFTNQFPDGVTIDKDKSTCDGITELKANQSCSWVGTVTPALETSSYVVSSTLHYQQGDDVLVQSNSQVSSVAISVTSAYSSNIYQGYPYFNAATGQQAEVTSKFTNTSKILPATGISLSWDNALYTPTGTCLSLAKDELLPGESCEITISFNSGNMPSVKGVWIKLLYNEGNSILAGLPLAVNLPTGPIAEHLTHHYSGWAWPRKPQRFTRLQIAKGEKCQGALYDALTNLAWARTPSVPYDTWGEANLFAQESNLCGYNNWRLPTVNELLSIIPFQGNKSVRDILAQYGFYFSQQERLYTEETNGYDTHYVVLLLDSYAGDSTYFLTDNPLMLAKALLVRDVG